MFTKEILQQKIDSTKWFHTMDLPYMLSVDDDAPARGYIKTPGIVNHCNWKLATERFGIPEDLTGKDIIDIGAYDGYFSFVAANRNAHSVLAIDPLQDCSNIEHKASAFRIARTALELDEKVAFLHTDLEGRSHDVDMYDISFYFGVLYHVTNPLQELKHLHAITREYALIETAICTVPLSSKRPLWEFKPGHNGDNTNMWYPSIAGLRSACYSAGFTSFKEVYMSDDMQRATFKATI